MTSCSDERTSEEMEFYEMISGIVLSTKCQTRRIAHASLNDGEEVPLPACCFRNREGHNWKYKDVPGNVPKGFYEVCGRCLHLAGLVEHPNRKPHD